MNVLEQDAVSIEQLAEESIWAVTCGKIVQPEWEVSIDERTGLVVCIFENEARFCIDTADLEVITAVGQRLVELTGRELSLLDEEGVRLC